MRKHLKATVTGQVLETGLKGYYIVKNISQSCFMKTSGDNTLSSPLLRTMAPFKNPPPHFRHFFQSPSPLWKKLAPTPFLKGGVCWNFHMTMGHGIF